MCPPDTLMAVCDISEVPPYADYDAFITAGGVASDSCSLDTSSFTLLSEVSNGMTCPDTITRTYILDDSCGNRSSCTQIIVVNDTIPPTLTCPPDTSVQCLADVPPAFLNGGAGFADFVAAGGSVDDNCGTDLMIPVSSLR